MATRKQTRTERQWRGGTVLRDTTGRSRGEEPQQGHFVRIDLTDPAALKGVEAMVGEGEARPGNGDYGVYTAPATVDDDGNPVTAMVLLRDGHACTVLVPFEALSPAPAGLR